MSVLESGAPEICDRTLAFGAAHPASLEPLFAVKWSLSRVCGNSWP